MTVIDPKGFNFFQKLKIPITYELAEELAAWKPAKAPEPEPAARQVLNYLLFIFLSCFF